MRARELAGYCCVGAGVVGLAAVLVLLAERAAAPPTEPSDLITLGQERLAGGDLLGAEEWFAKAARSSPDAGLEAHAATARIRELRGETDGALEAYRAAADAAPGQLAPALALARALARTGRRSEAAAVLRGARGEHPEAPEPLLELAALALAGGDLRRAVEVYGTLERIAPGDARGALGVAAVEEAAGHVEAARAAYERARAADEQSPEAMEGLGRLAAAAGDFEGAERAYRRVVELRRGDPMALAVHATLVERLGRYEEAARMFRRVLDALRDGGDEVRESRALAWTGLGTCQLALGRTDEAYEALASALTDEPGQREALWALAPIYLEREEWARAARALRGVVPSRADEPLLWVLMGRAEAGQGRWAEARQSFERALELDERHFEARLWLGISLRALGVYRGAVALLTRVADQRPGDGLASLNLAIAHGQLGETEVARRRFVDARRAMPERPEPLYHEAHLLLALGMTAEALALAREAVDLAPEDPGALEVIARALDASGDPVGARARAREAARYARDDAQRQYLEGLGQSFEGPLPGES